LNQSDDGIIQKNKTAIDTERIFWNKTKNKKIRTLLVVCAWSGMKYYYQNFTEDAAN